MVAQVFFTIVLTTATPTVGATINTTHGKEATKQLQTLPRTDTTWATIGTLFANRIFMMESENKRRDADSAIYYFRKAQETFPTDPIIAAYLTVSIGLRAKEDNSLQKLFGGTKERAHTAFVTMDSIRKAYPENLTVQFVSACMFRDASKHFKDAHAFQLMSYQTFQNLHVLALEGKHPTFFTPDVYSHVLLSLAMLVEKLEDQASADTLACQYISQLIDGYPHSPAAEYARSKKLVCE